MLSSDESDGEVHLISKKGNVDFCSDSEDVAMPGPKRVKKGTMDFDSESETEDKPPFKNQKRKVKAQVKVTERPKPSKGAAKSPSKTCSADTTASESSFVPARVQTNNVAHAKINTPHPKEPSIVPRVDKYKLSKPTEHVVQLKEKSPYNKLLSWLLNWHTNNLGEAAQETKNECTKHDADGRSFNVALLSGPPGIGKTISAVMACEELGLAYTKLNASDAINEKILYRLVESNTTDACHVLILDDVDCISGNQDVVGITELSLMTKIPIIYICNEGHAQKFRALGDQYFDVRFNRPSIAQIMDVLMRIISREQLKVSNELVKRIIETSNQDIRQCIYSLQLIAAGLSNENELQPKDVSVNIFDVAMRLTHSETKLMVKQEMFFTSYSTRKTNIPPSSQPQEAIFKHFQPVKEDYPCLSADAENIVMHAWDESRSLSEKFVEGFGAQITRKDMLTLKGLAWLNDEVINFYVSLICERAKNDVYAFNTFFFSTIQQRGFAGVKRWTRKIDVFNFDVILVPIHHGAHWCLAVINFETMRLEYFDSMLGYGLQYLQILRDYLVQEHQDKKGSPMKFDFTLNSRQDIPRQFNGSDCGMFTCKFAEYASRKEVINFEQRHMPYFRQRMVWEIYQKKLL